jgi:predicted P-loop ATPase
MSGEGQGRKAPGYQLEQGMLGSLLSFGRAALDAALAAGWRPELARRPQVAALGVWLVEQMEQGNVVDLPTAVAQFQMFPPQHKDAPSLAEALGLLVPAPNIAASCVEDVAAHARAIIEAKRTDRISELVAGINAASRTGDLDTIAKLSEQMAAVAKPPKPKRERKTEALDSDSAEDKKPDPETVTALKKIPSRARDDRRVQARVVLEHDPRWAKLVYNEMRQQIELDGRLYTDADDSRTTDWLSWVYGIQIGRDVAAAVVDLVARKRSYDPLRDFLYGLDWDGTHRLDSWLMRGFGVEDSELHRRIGACWMIGAVARALQPGCQMDTMLVFVGRQGAGKTRGVEALTGREFFSETELRIGEIRGLQQLGDAWIHELGEMTPLLANRVDRNVFKNFLTTRVDKYQRLHAKRSGEYPRRCVFIGTANDKELLNDPTGARRFWPVTATTVDLDWIRRERAQLWAEARVRFERGEAWHLARAEEAELERLQRPFRKTDPWEEPLAAWLSLPERSQDTETSITASRLLSDVIGRPLGLQTQADKTRVGTCMAAIGWHHKAAWCRIARKTVNCYMPDERKDEVDP